MKALVFDPGSDAFSIADLPEPIPGARDVLIKVDACGLNPVDAKIGLWKTLWPDMDASWVPGLDVSGHIVALGDAVDQWQIGDRVLCHGDMFRPHGGFAEYSVQAADIVIPHPQLPATLAASLPCAGWTAWRALTDKLRVRAQQSILIIGGSGGVGGFAIQIAAHFGLPTIIATCSAANRDYVKSLGATHVIDYQSEDVVSRVLSITDQQGVSLALDTVGPDNDIAAANALGFEGQLLTLVDIARPAMYEDAFMRGLSFHQLSLGAGHRNGPAAQSALTEAGRTFVSLVEAGSIKAPAMRTIALAEGPSALREMLAQRTVGKIVLDLHA